MRQRYKKHNSLTGFKDTEEKSTRHQKVWSWSSWKRLEILEMRIKWNFKGITIPFIPNKNTCQNGGSKNCITGFIFSLWSFFVFHRKMLHDERSKQVVNGTLTFCQVKPLSQTTGYEFYNFFPSLPASIPLYYHLSYSIKKNPKMKRKPMALKLQLCSQTGHTDLLMFARVNQTALAQRPISYFLFNITLLLILNSGE